MRGKKKGTTTWYTINMNKLNKMIEGEAWGWISLNTLSFPIPSFLVCLFVSFIQVEDESIS